MNWTLPASLALAAALLACAGAPATPSAAASSAQAAPGAPADYFPLAVGNAWTYLDRSSPGSTPVRRSVRVVERDGEGYFVDDQRGALRADHDCLHDRTRRLLCQPLRRGHVWSSVVSAAAVERYEIAGVGETVAVPAGTFHGCLRVRSQLRSGGVEQVAELTYAPGVGLVRLETFAVVEGVARPQVRGELESYRVGAR